MDTVFRTVGGRKVDEAQYRDELLRRRGVKKKRYERIGEDQLEWGGGIYQKEELERRLQEEAKISQQPLANHDIDEEYDQELRLQHRSEDPMAKYLERKSRRKRDSDKDGERAGHKDPGHTSRPGHKDTSRPARPVCKFPAPPNRYGIKPGYRWDGRIRGNGFEAKLLQAINQAKSKPSIMMSSAMD